MGEESTMTIQKTSKRLKLQKALGVFLVMSSFLWAAMADEGNMAAPACLLAFACVVYVQARIRTWWHHH